MSVFFIMIIMLVAGVLGGTINCFLSASDEKVTSKPSIWRCILIGIGATVLVPLFLEIAQSKLLDNVRASWDLAMVKPEIKKSELEETKDRDTSYGTASRHAVVDSNSNTTQNKKKKVKSGSTSVDETTTPPLKSYLLLASYCLLAAAAGPRFINNLMDGVLKAHKIENLQKENTKVSQEKKKIEKAQQRETAMNSLHANEDEKIALSNTENSNILAAVIKPQIGPKTVPDDPQKGRFGGKRQQQDRMLCAEVKKSQINGFFKVTIWVETTDSGNPLTGDVIFYLHDTFRPSVVTLKEADFLDGKASLDPKLAWGAFTVGAVVDNGETLLEYDLAEDEDFPEDFRAR